MSDDLLDKGQRDRSHIAMGQPHEVQYWTRHLGVTRDGCSGRSTRSGIPPQRCGRNSGCWVKSID